MSISGAPLSEIVPQVDCPIPERDFHADTTTPFLSEITPHGVSEMATQSASVDLVMRLVHVERTFPGPPKVEALRDATFSVSRGEHVAIMGPSGSGKSTLLNVLGLLDSASSGRYEFDGRDVSALSEGVRTALRRDLIGFVFQDFYMLPQRTAVENAALGVLYAGVSKRQRIAAATAALQRVGLADRTYALAATLSGGERQRVAIARALVGDPVLLLCDEPTGNLDSANKKQVMEIIDDLNKDGVTVITITHDLETAQWASRSLRITDGVVTDGVVRDGLITYGVIHDEIVHDRVVPE